ncbi:hypothetical protein EYF80_050636 [Liparis tanakae]|uniref:Uncharacterized protein n=1 Tax=Liparis tanakae TaxID=230148 RepID=A0A4Z2FE94_9TELE|nr:hypothetical protein EYF80_050636 [Liparis tanakae]
MKAPQRSQTTSRLSLSQSGRSIPTWVQFGSQQLMQRDDVIVPAKGHQGGTDACLQRRFSPKATRTPNRKFTMCRMWFRIMKNKSLINHLPALVGTRRGARGGGLPVGGLPVGPVPAARLTATTSSRSHREPPAQHRGDVRGASATGPGKYFSFLFLRKRHGDSRRSQIWPQIGFPTPRQDCDASVRNSNSPEASRPLGLKTSSEASRPQDLKTSSETSRPQDLLSGLETSRPQDLL